MTETFSQSVPQEELQQAEAAAHVVNQRVDEIADERAEYGATSAAIETDQSYANSPGAAELIKSAETIYNMNPMRFSEIDSKDFGNLVSEYDDIRNKYAVSDEGLTMLDEIEKLAFNNKDGNTFEYTWNKLNSDELKLLSLRVRSGSNRDYLLDRIDQIGAKAENPSEQALKITQDGAPAPIVSEVRSLFSDIKDELQFGQNAATVEYNQFVVSNANPSSPTWLAANQYLETAEAKSAIRRIDHMQRAQQNAEQFQNAQAA